jgi:hypothetical protein
MPIFSGCSLRSLKPLHYKLSRLTWITCTLNQSGTEQVLVSQWIEILPTDQAVALEVKYDPKTLQIITANDGRLFWTRSAKRKDYMYPDHTPYSAQKPIAQDL